jgi:hypothetical protein
LADEAQPDLVLFSSTQRRRYLEDNLTALALPPDSVIQFRYGRTYVASQLQEAVSKKTVIGQRVLLAMISDTDGPAPPFVLPVRFATVVYAEPLADMYIFKLRIAGYPILRNYPGTEDDIRSHSISLLQQLKQQNQGTYFPATTRFPDFHVGGGGDQTQNWVDITERLAVHPAYANSFFLRLGSPIQQNGRSISFDGEGRLRVSAHDSARLQVSFLSREYTEVKKALVCSTDGKFLRVSSEETYDVASRYDNVEFWLQPSAIPFEAYARATVQLVYDPSLSSTPPTTSVRFPVVIRRSRSRVASRIATTALGALLVALPAILGQNSSLALRILCAIVGATLISLATAVAPRNV